MKLTVVRHGETLENAGRIVQGQLPGTLSEVGLRQAEEVARKLMNRQFDEVWSSDLLRCVKTGEEILKYHPSLAMELTPVLREQNFGIFQGKPGPIEWDSLPGNWLTRRPPKGESMEEIYTRVINFINNLLKKSKHQNILVITHGGPIRIMIAAYEQMPLPEMYKQSPPNAGVWEFEINKPLEPLLNKA